MAVHTYAVIDVGSFELELSVYQIKSDKTVSRVDHVRHVIALGRDTYNTGKIGNAYVDEICKVLEDFTAIMTSYKVEGYRACATSALREAANRPMVLDQIKVRTGIDVDVLSNSMQRFLCYEALPAKEPAFQEIISQGTAIVDVSFGSTQISLYDKEKLIVTQNIKLGALRILEKLAVVTMEKNNLHELVAELIDGDIATFGHLYLKEVDVKNIIVIGDGMRLFVNKIMKRPFGRISSVDFLEAYERHYRRNGQHMVEEYGIPAEFANLIIPSAMICQRVVHTSQAENLWISDVTLSDGIVMDYCFKSKLVRAPHDFEEDILSSAHQINKRYLGSKAHAKVLESNVCAVFDRMKKYHGLGKRERLLLRLSAIMHECGKFISMGDPGESSYHIIMASEIIGLSHEERVMVANLARLNATHGANSASVLDHLSMEQWMTVVKLGAILRIGNAMDKSHKQKFKNIKLVVKDRQLLITTNTLEDITLERGLFEQKADFFEEVYGIRPVLRKKTIPNQ